MRPTRAIAAIIASLALASVVVATSAAVDDADVRVFNYHVLSNPADADGGGELSPIRIVGTPNGTFSGAIGIEADGELRGLRADVAGLSLEGDDSQRIDGELIQVRFAQPFDTAIQRRRPGGHDVLHEHVPARLDGIVGVWVTATVPADTQPGTYRGEMRFGAQSMGMRSVDVELTVHEFPLPAAREMHTWVDLIQSPDTLALEYGVELWSEEHWSLMEQSFKHMAQLGDATVYIPILARTNFGNEESMVWWSETEDGRYARDYTIMDRYLDLAIEHLGEPELVVFQVWDVVLAESAPAPHHMREESQAARAAVADKGPRVTGVDPETGERESIFLPRLEDEQSRLIWRDFFDELRARMSERGLERAMMLGMLTDAEPSREQVEVLHDASMGLPWASHAHPERIRDKPVRGNRLLRGIADIRYAAHVYRIRYQVNPQSERLHGWAHPELTAFFGRNGQPNGHPLRARLAPEQNITGRQRGLGRLGADVWYVLEDRRGRRTGAVYHRYPENNWRNLDIESWILAPGPQGPLATARLENMREGLQEAEARIYIEAALMDDQTRRYIDDALAERARTILDDRQFAMWRSVWPRVDDLEKLGALGVHGNARNPIEAVWQALADAGHDLPGYWDSEARTMRSDAEREGRIWFAGSNWQQRTADLYTVAGEIHAALTEQGLDGYDAIDRIRERHSR
ncbi:MAG: glycoside hydrolase domain-containing protein [Phycisphaeraceae bacterium]